MERLKTNQILWLIFLAVYLVIHLYTLSLNPLPWQDETYNASITKSFLESGKLIPQVAGHATNFEEDLRYGPFYFWITSLTVKILGFGTFQIRLVTLLFGLGCIGLTLLLFKQRNISYYSSFQRQSQKMGDDLESVEKYGDSFSALTHEPLRRRNDGSIIDGLLTVTQLSMLLLISFALDPYYFRCMHEGRNDLVASFFMLAATFFLLKSVESTKWKWWQLLSGAMVGFAILTTPRSGFLLVGLIAYLLLTTYKKPFEIIQRVIIWAIPPILMYLIWILYAFGSLENFIVYYQQYMGYTQLEGLYLYIPKGQMGLIFMTGIAVIYGVIKNRMTFFTPLTWLCLVSIFTFYLAVKDSGPYAAFIIPHYYLLLFGSLFK